MRYGALVGENIATKPEVRHDAENMRNKILEHALKELAQNGPEFFDTAKLCRELFIARSLINHHFGNQVGLIAETVVLAYERYVLELRNAASKKDSPENRLEAWMLAQVNWYSTHQGIAMIVNYPHRNYTAIFEAKFKNRLQNAFRFNMTVLAILVRDIHEQTVSAIDFSISDAPYASMVSANTANSLRSATVGMGSLGGSVWSAGRAMTARDLRERYLEDAAVMHHIGWVIKSIDRK